MRSSEVFAPNGRSYDAVIGEYEEEAERLRWKASQANARASWWCLVAVGVSFVAVLGWLT